MVQLGESDLDAGMAFGIGKIAAREHRFAQVRVSEAAARKSACDEARARKHDRGKLGIDQGAVTEPEASQVALAEVIVRQVQTFVSATRFELGEVLHANMP